MMASIEQRLADELSVSVRQVTAAMALLDEGATVPFIARYRKEMTGGLDDSQLRILQERLVYLRELEQRRQTVIDSIRAQDKMTPELLAAIQQAQDKPTLEDIYLPFRPKRRTRAKLAIEAGLDKLADSLMANPLLNPEEEAIRYVRSPFSTPDGDNPGVADAKAALDGARQVLMERFSEDAVLLAKLREFFREHGVLVSHVTEGAEQEGVRFSDYFDYEEPVSKIASHRVLAILRGRREEVLSVRIRLDSEAERPQWDDPFNPCETRIAAHFGISDKGRPSDKWLRETVRWAWRIRILSHLETELFGELREKAEA